MRFVTMLVVAACALTPAGAATAAPGPTTVARYGFDSTGVGGTIADLTGRGVPLQVRAADGGALRFFTHGTGRAVSFPARCAATTTTCPRVILEGGDDADLDPGSRPFRYGATVLLTSAQAAGTSANIMQKGVATAESQWKMQVGKRGKPNCVLAGRGSRATYVARATVPVVDGQWHQIECRRSSTSLSIFVDNMSRGSVVVPASLNISNSLPLRIGGRNLSNRSDQFSGALDEAFVSLG